MSRVGKKRSGLVSKQWKQQKQCTTSGGLFLKVGDCVTVSSGEDLPFIAKIDAIEEREGEIQFSVKWFYRPEECFGGRKIYHARREILASNHIDKISEQTLIKKVRVFTDETDYVENQGVGQEEYFCRSTFNPANRTFEPSRVKVYCFCEMPYNPDMDMIGCASCAEWYHPACLNIPNPETLDDHWICPKCVAGSGALEPRGDTRLGAARPRRPPAAVR